MSYKLSGQNKNRTRAMPLTNYICPSGESVTVERCLSAGSCDHRCASMSSLKLISDARKWTGTPSCTQLISGTREEYLKIKHDYSATPESRMFAIVGTKAHNALEAYSGEDNPGHARIIAEHAVEWNGITGTLDEIDEENGKRVLIDHKTSGSFKVKQALDGDLGDWGLQLNFYRMAYELQNAPVKIDEMKIEAIVRDGGTWIAKKRGVERNLYMINVPKITNKDVAEYFNTKKENLISALHNNTTPLVCTEEERWDDLKCKAYCPVKKHCEHGRSL